MKKCKSEKLPVNFNHCGDVCTSIWFHVSLTNSLSLVKKKGFFCLAMVEILKQVLGTSSCCTSRSGTPHWLIRIPNKPQLQCHLRELWQTYRHGIVVLINNSIHLINLDKITCQKIHKQTNTHTHTNRFMSNPFNDHKITMSQIFTDTNIK